MITLTERDKKYIESNKDSFYSVKGLRERLFMIRKNFGKKGEEKVIKEMKDQGFDFDLSEIKKKKTMPYSLFIAFLVVEAKVFDYNDKDLRSIGKEMTKTSYITRFLSKFLVSPDMIANNADRMWRRYNSGKLVVKEMDEENKRSVLEIRDAPPGHPYFCRTLEGYIGGIFSLAVGKEAKCREEKCPFKDEGNIHRFVVTW